MKYYDGKQEAADIMVSYQYFNIFQVCIYILEKKQNIRKNIRSYYQPA